MASTDRRGLLLHGMAVGERRTVSMVVLENALAIRAREEGIEGEREGRIFMLISPSFAN